MASKTVTEIIPGATKTRRTVVETVVTTRDEVLIHYGIGLGFRPRRPGDMSATAAWNGEDD